MPKTGEWTSRTSRGIRRGDEATWRSSGGPLWVQPRRRHGPGATGDSLRTPKKWWFLPPVCGVFKEGLGIYVLYVSIHIYIYISLYIYISWYIQLDVKPNQATFGHNMCHSFMIVMGMVYGIGWIPHYPQEPQYVSNYSSPNIDRTIFQPVHSAGNIISFIPSWIFTLCSDHIAVKPIIIIILLISQLYPIKSIPNLHLHDVYSGKIKHQTTF